VLRAGRKQTFLLLLLSRFRNPLVSSVFDFLTFYVMLHVFKAQEALFQTGWFIESLATQVLVGGYPCQRAASMTDHRWTTQPSMTNHNTPARTK
jgi:hypothetical protein